MLTFKVPIKTTSTQGYLKRTQRRTDIHLIWPIYQSLLALEYLIKLPVPALSHNVKTS